MPACTRQRPARRNSFRSTLSIFVLWAVDANLALVPNKVNAGFFSFTEVLDGRHREYDEWHLLDHMPENFMLEGLQWGQRWVATPELIERRLFSTSDLAKTQYVTLYLITEPVTQALEDFYALGRTLYSEGRFFEPRKSHLSGPFSLV